MNKRSIDKNKRSHDHGLLQNRFARVGFKGVNPADLATNETAS